MCCRRSKRTMSTRVMCGTCSRIPARPRGAGRVGGRALPRARSLSALCRDDVRRVADLGARSKTSVGAIKEMARRAGMSGDEFEKCLSTEDDAKKDRRGADRGEQEILHRLHAVVLAERQRHRRTAITADFDEKLRAELKAKGVDIPAAATRPKPRPATGRTAARPTGSTPATGAAAPAAVAPPPATPPAAPAPSKPASGTPSP